MPGSNSLSSIQHIVVLMLENRSFDHMLGFLYTGSGNVSPAGQPYDGLTGSESNPVSSGPPFTVFKIEPTTPNAYFMPGADPGEGYMATNDQLFGSESAPANSSLAPPNDGFLKDFTYTLGWQSREGGWSILPGTTGQDIMGCFAPETLPVLSGLARGYAVCDQWFSSVPGMSVPVATEPGPAAGQPSHLQEVQAELVSRQFPAGVSPAPGKTGPAPGTAAALASYIRAHA
jgi:phospholipase C